VIGKGNLTISKENMVEAMQAWIDKRWTVDPPVITNILIIDGNGIDREFSNLHLRLESNKHFMGVPEAGGAGDPA
jgi:hypothetical protein